MKSILLLVALLAAIAVVANLFALMGNSTPRGLSMAGRWSAACARMRLLPDAGFVELASLQAKAQEAVKEARTIAETAQAASRSMTDDEQKNYDGAMQRGRDLLEQIKAAKKDAKVLEDAKALAEEIGLPESAVDDLDAQSGKSGQTVRERVKSLGLQVVDSQEFKAMMAPYKGGAIPEKTRVQSDPIAVKNLVGHRRKAIVTGASDTSGGAFVVNEQSGIVEMLGRRTLVLRDVISVRRTGSDTVEYVRQTSHTNAAAPVAEATSAASRTVVTSGVLQPVVGGGYKPEGAWAFERDTAVVKTIAEWVPATKRALADVAALEGLINDELRADLAEKEEDEIVSGDGTGEHFDGMLHVSGTQAQAFSTDIFETVRKALTKVRTIGRAVPNGVGLNPTDVETIDLARDNEDRFYGGGPFASGPRTLWGVPIVESEAFPAGFGTVADFRKTVLWDREQATVSVSDSHEDFFIRNLVAILGEERAALAHTRPLAICVADLTP